MIDSQVIYGCWHQHSKATVVCSHSCVLANKYLNFTKMWKQWVSLQMPYLLSVFHPSSAKIYWTSTMHQVVCGTRDSVMNKTDPNPNHPEVQSQKKTDNKYKQIIFCMPKNMSVITTKEKKTKAVKENRKYQRCLKCNYF